MSKKAWSSLIAWGHNAQRANTLAFYCTVCVCGASFPSLQKMNVSFSLLGAHLHTLKIYLLHTQTRTRRTQWPALKAAVGKTAKLWMNCSHTDIMAPERFWQSVFRNVQVSHNNCQEPEAPTLWGSVGLSTTRLPSDAQMREGGNAKGSIHKSRAKLTNLSQRWRWKIQRNPLCYRSFGKFMLCLFRFHSHVLLLCLLPNLLPAGCCQPSVRTSTEGSAGVPPWMSQSVSLTKH